MRAILDPGFRPSVLAHRAFRALGGPAAQLALEQPDGSVFHFTMNVSPDGEANRAHLLRLARFALWSRGGFRFYFDGPPWLAGALQAHYSDTDTGRFDSETVGRRIYDRPIEVVPTGALPPERALTTPLGRHLGGCRIGFDLGGSDRKVAAVIDGKVVFSEETEWDPYVQPDPQYHIDGITDSLRKAAAHLPRVDAIGGSAAGVYVGNQVKVAGLFRAVPPQLFEQRVRNMFFDLRRAWNDVPFEVVNDGEVTALAGSMALGANAVLGLALGTSTAGGYVNADGNITSWLNELAFVPVDEAPEAAVDEWSGERGCGAKYLSQQAVGRLLAPAGITVDPALPLPRQLEHLQALMKEGDRRAHDVYQTLGVYLGYALAHFADFYDFRHVLVLGRVTSGAGGDLMLEIARQLLADEFPALAERIALHIPDEKQKRHGQAIAAASLPAPG